MFGAISRLAKPKPLLSRALDPANIGYWSTVIGGRFSRSGDITGRIGKAALYSTAGLATAGYISHAADMKRAYYGESRYQSQYGRGAEAIAGTAMLAGLWYGGWSLLQKDPISRIQGSFRYWTKERGMLRASRAAKPELLRYNKGLTMSAKDLGGTAGYSAPIGPMMPDASQINRIRQLRQQVLSPIVEGKILGTARVGLIGRTGRTFEENVFGKVSALARTSTWLMGMGVALGAGGAPLAEGLVGLGGFAAIGIGGAGLLASSKVFGDASMGRFFKGFAMSAGVIAGSSALGAYAGMRVSPPTAEGTIQSFDQGSVVGRMNWSTAGLVQALHRNNSRVI